jgi:hypothetical protein
MGVADLQSGLGQMTQAFAQLRDEWTAAAEHWNDDARRKFEEACLAPLPAHLKLVVTAANQLQAAIAAAEKELGDGPDTEA